VTTRTLSWMTSTLAAVCLLSPGALFAQQNVPPAAQRTEAEVENAGRRFGGGVQGGVGLDPEIINVGAHATFGPVFRPTLQLRPGIEFGLGEVTTTGAVSTSAIRTSAAA
jgi:hypothetical protein